MCMSIGGSLEGMGVDSWVQRNGGESKLYNIILWGETIDVDLHT